MKKKINFLRTNTGKVITFIAIIPARGNSQRIKNKNMINLNGKPLIYWTLKSALNSKYINNICVTSDSKIILDFCSKFKIETILRPKRLSGNVIMPDEAIQHAYLKLKKKYDYIVMLQPTSPLRFSKDIDEAIETLINEKSKSLFSSSIQSSFIWKKNKKNFYPINYKVKNRPRSQDISFYCENGAIYITKSSLFLKEGIRLCGKISTFVMPNKRSLEIDNFDDLKKIEKFMKFSGEKF